MPQRPVLLTLDTACVSALANPQPSNSLTEVAALERLVDLATGGAINLQLTAAYERDFERWNDESGRARRLAWLSEAHLLRRAPGVFRLDVSRLGGADTLGGELDAELDKELRKILRPSLLNAENVPSHEDAPGVAARLFSDIDHLVAHSRSSARWFVTLDEKTILSKRGALQDVGIAVRKPSEAIQSLADIKTRRS